MGLKHQAASARKWRAAIRQTERHFPAHLPPLLFLTDPDRISDPLPILDALPPGSGVIYRHFGANDRLRKAKALSESCARNHLTLLIAADPELALRVGASGVHWPETMLSKSRSWRRRFLVQTASAHTPRAIRAADKAGMDAVLYSAIFSSQSASAGSPLGSSRFRRTIWQHSIPIYALGGITPDTAGRIASFGGLAAVSGISIS